MHDNLETALKKGALLCWHHLPSSFWLAGTQRMAGALAFESVGSSQETTREQEPGSLIIVESPPGTQCLPPDSFN